MLTAARCQLKAKPIFYFTSRGERQKSGWLVMSGGAGDLTRIVTFLIGRSKDGMNKFVEGGKAAVIVSSQSAATRAGATFARFNGCQSFGCRTGNNS